MNSPPKYRTVSDALNCSLKCSDWKGCYIKVTNIKGLCLLGQAQPSLKRMTVKSQHFPGAAHVMWCARRAQRNASALRVPLVSLRRLSAVQERKTSDAKYRLWGGEREREYKPHGRNNKRLLLLFSQIWERKKTLRSSRVRRKITSDIFM